MREQADWCQTQLQYIKLVIIPKNFGNCLVIPTPPLLPDSKIMLRVGRAVESRQSTDFLKLYYSHSQRKLMIKSANSCLANYLVNSLPFQDKLS